MLLFFQVVFLTVIGEARVAATTGKQSFRVWNNEGKEAEESILQKGDLVRVALKYRWPNEYPPPGFFMGKTSDKMRGEEIIIEIPSGITMANSNGAYCCGKRESYPVKDISHIHFLARGAAALSLFHLTGGLMAENQHLKERLRNIRQMSDI